MRDVLLAVDQVSKQFHDGQQTIEVLKRVSFEVQVGQSVAIVGESGSGKSTLLHILGTLERPTAGTITLTGQSYQSLSAPQQAQLRNQQLGFVYQFHHLLSEFDALENIAMPALIAGQTKQATMERARLLLDQVGLSHRQHHVPSELSGGERQRVAIARALMNRPALILADEPTGNLDTENGRMVYELMMQLTQAENTCFVIVTHDRQLASQLDRTLVMHDGQLEEV
ncbi:MAG: lipoprotein-releasing ABC transporter ATP-binding protein LolD [Shewanellaceae bacterium]|nr:lipoprotein-releasing ABC transporter ATP-binding protein LolD [Shewanellaceae bacterium]